MQLRPYQQRAHDSIMAWVKSSIEPCLVEAVTAAGKSHVIAAVANTVHKISGKRILCIAPSAELVVQNTEKYRATGNPASIFSASAGGKCLRHPVVFGTPGTIKNRIRRFGQEFAMVVIDEAHGITPTIKHIIDTIREKNPNLRVVGLTATPYRLGDGYIYAMDDTGKAMGESCCRNPYFTKLVERITGHELLQLGFLTPYVIGAIGADSYDTLHMMPNSRGKFSEADIDRAYHGHGRKTAAIIADVVLKSQGRDGVMIFAATVQHAHECMASLPPGLSALVTGETPKGERAKIIKRFKARKIKYLVNVSVLTTGFDAPHVSVIALLRKTESVGLLQQMVGRGMRIDDDKDDFLILDYANNIESHCPDGDIFNPKIKAAYKAASGSEITCKCPECGIENEFSARQNDDGFNIDENGYFVDLDGVRIPTEHGDMPAHHGRRCRAMLPGPGGVYLQCGYRWTFKECQHCAAENDIAARYCSSCKGELIDPAEKLAIEFAAYKKDPTRIQTDKVISWSAAPTMTRRGEEAMLVKFLTEYRSFTVWLFPNGKYPRARAGWAQYQDQLAIGTPCTVTYRKNPDSGFYEVHDYNREADEI